MMRAAVLVFCLMLGIAAGAKAAAPLLPDRGQIAFSRVQMQSRDIYLLDVRTTLTYNLTRTADAGEITPAWSVDGQRLAFVIGDANSVRAIDFSRAGLPVTGVAGAALAEYYPIWIAGSTALEISAAYLPVQVYEHEKLELRSLGGDVSMQPAYAPAGGRIVYVGMDESFNPGVLRTADLATDVITTLTPRGYVFQYPAWSPDGRYLAAQYERGQISDLVILDVGCLPRCVDAMRVLVQALGRASGPAWSADGGSIAYSCRVDRATSALCLYDLAMDRSYALTSPAPGLVDSEPAWRPGIGQP
ncbi:MAG: PD40 domain-containing protein [Anaerolineae bacterium]|nr:PD40 domain-containing protein [Anaerolineae bacterium]